MKIILLFLLAAVYPNSVAAQWSSKPMPKKFYRQSMSFVSAAVGVAQGFASSRPAVYSTLDSGKTWSLWRVEPWDYEEYALRKIALASSGVGWVVGSVGVFRTSDFGVTWHNDSLALPDSLRGGSTITDWSVVEVSESWAFIAGCRDGRMVLCRRDMADGSLWQSIQLPGQQSCILRSDVRYETDVDGTMTPDGTGFLSTRADTLFASRDDGRTWEIRSLLKETLGWFDFFDLSFSDSLHGWASGGIIASTRDGGRTWQFPKKQPAVCSSLCFVDTLCGWVADGSALEMTIDGGRTWTQQLLGDLPFPLQIVDDKYIMTIGDDSLWSADYRSLCDSTTSHVTSTNESRPNRICMSTDRSIEIDLRQFQLSGTVSIVICDAIGRTLWRRSIAGNERDTPIRVDLSSHGTGVYIVAIADGVSSTGETVLLCH